MKRSDKRSDRSDNSADELTYNYEGNNARLKKAFRSVKNDINYIAQRTVSNENKLCQTEESLKNLFKKMEYLEDVQKKILDALAEKLDKIKHDYAKEEHLILTKEHLDKRMSILNRNMDEAFLELGNSLLDAEKNAEKTYLAKKEFRKYAPQVDLSKSLSKQISSLSRAIDEKTSFIKEELDNTLMRLNNIDKKLNNKVDSVEFIKMSKQKADAKNVIKLSNYFENIAKKLNTISDEFNSAKEKIAKVQNALVDAVVKDDFVSQMVVFEKKISHLHKEIEYVREDMHKFIQKSLSRKNSENQSVMLDEDEVAQDVV